MTLSTIRNNPAKQKKVKTKKQKAIAATCAMAFLAIGMACRQPLRRL